MVESGRKSRADVIAELNRLLQRTLNKVIFESPLGHALFLQEDLPRQLIVLLEQKLKGGEIQRIDEFEAFVENLESWYIGHLTELNREKKLYIHQTS